MGEEGRNGKELAYQRFLLYKEILSTQIKRIKTNRPLRTPKVRAVIKFGSTLKKIEGDKNRLKAFRLDI